MFGIGLVLGIADTILALGTEYGLSTITSSEENPCCDEPDEDGSLGRKKSLKFAERWFLLQRARSILEEMELVQKLASEDPPFPGADETLKQLEEELDRLEVLKREVL